MVHFRKAFVVLSLLLAPLWSIGQSSNPVGDAFISGENCYTITSNTNWQLGAVWFNEFLSFDEDFEIITEVNLGSNPAGADGIVMVFQQVGIDAIGEPGGGLGFEGFFPSLGIEIDTFTNTDFGDPNFDHIAVVSNGSVNHISANNLSGPVAAIPGGATVCDGNFHLFRVTWNSSEQLLSIYFDCELRLTYSGDIVNNIFQGNPFVNWGFTGATGGSSNQQSVCINDFAAGLPPEFALCLGDTLQFDIPGAAEGSYSWSPVTYLDNPNVANPVAIPEEDIVYTVTFTDLCGQESTYTTSVSVAEVELEVPDFIEACEGDIVEIEASGNAEVYVWSNSTSGNITTVEENTILSVTAYIGSCKAFGETEIVFQVIPSTDLETEYTICEGDSLELLITSVPEAQASWSDGTSGTSFTSTEPGTYTLQLTSDAGCENTYTFSLESISFPEPALQSEAVICQGESLVVDAGEASSYLWSTGDQTATLTITEGGQYTVTLANELCTSTAMIEVTENPAPDMNFPASFEQCADDTLYISAGDDFYTWFLDGEQFTDSIALPGGGQALIEAIDPENGCFNAQELLINVVPPPTPILPEGSTLCEGQPLLLSATVIGPASEVIWDTGDEGPLLQIIAPGTYTVTATNDCGSASATTVVEEVKCDCPVYVPNAFSPDLDGVNELFFPVISCDVRDYAFSIFNRWGQRLFSSTTPGEGWNGSGAQGTHWVAGEVYIWQLRFQADIPGELMQVARTGHVVLLR